MKPVVLLILDGWGIAAEGDGNPLVSAKTPILRELVSSFPAVTLRSSGETVGLSWGEMGNSEVGHLTIGAGRVFYQSFPRINLAIQNGEFANNEAFMGSIKHVKKNKSKLHIMGILSPGNVHGSDAHIHALLDFAVQNGIKNVVLHPILDGRDTIFNTGIQFIKELQEKLKQTGVGVIGSVSGRYYAMDRDHRFERTEKAFLAMTGKGPIVDDAASAIQESYDKKIYDEEFVPVTVGQNGEQTNGIANGDAVIFANFRPDRARQITESFVVPDFNAFPRDPIQDLFFVTMTEYEKGLPVSVAFPPEIIKTCLAKIISDAGLKQLHIAETEKYAHVTFFLNGMREDPFPGEERVIVPSPRVASYDEVPEMSVHKIAERIVKEIDAGTFDIIIANFANADMVGHTGNKEATERAAEAIDSAVGDIFRAITASEGVLLITADHGNAEEVLNLQTGELDKEHSTNPVPFIVAGEKFRGKSAVSGEAPGGDLSLLPPVGMLTDVAPTVLALLDIPQPKEMTGSVLV